MKAEHVLTIYNLLKGEDINIWIDGGWCVDALLGEQTREHPDLDIAVDRKDEESLRTLLDLYGYHEVPHKDSSAWNYILENRENKKIDVHVFEFDKTGSNIYGIKYPKDSLRGLGKIAGQKVNCIAPEWMFKFKTAYEPKPKDLLDVNALAKKYDYSVPGTHLMA